MTNFDFDKLEFGGPWEQEFAEQQERFYQKYVLPAVQEIQDKLVPGVHYDFACEKEEYGGKVVVTLTATPKIPVYFDED